MVLKRVDFTLGSVKNTVLVNRLVSKKICVHLARHRKSSFHPAGRRKSRKPSWQTQDDITAAADRKSAWRTTCQFTDQTTKVADCSTNFTQCQFSDFGVYVVRPNEPKSKSGERKKRTLTSLIFMDACGVFVPGDFDRWPRLKEPVGPP